MENKRNKGFTLMELLIVVAIIAVLVAIAIPVLNKSLERSRQATDAANARSIKAQLATLIMNGDIEFAAPKKKDVYADNHCGVWVMVWNGDKLPGGYPPEPGTIFFGADDGVSVNGALYKGTTWSKNKKEIQDLFSPSFKNGNVKSYSRDEDTGWDWYIVQYTYDFNTNKLYSRVLSGFKGKNSQAFSSENKMASDGNIAKWLKD